MHGMRTWKIMTKPDKDAVLCRYFEENTTAAKCMYNVANFFIRNTMTGMRKSQKNGLPMKQKFFIMSLLGFKKQMLMPMKYTAKNGKTVKRREGWLELSVFQD